MAVITFIYYFTRDSYSFLVEEKKAINKVYSKEELGKEKSSTKFIKRN